VYPFIHERLYIMPEIMLVLQNLKNFIYSKPFAELGTIIAPEKHLPMVSLWFQKMSKFKAVFLPNFSNPGAAKFYDRWLANDTRPTLVRRKKVSHWHGLYYS
jgi:hypothetical protein